MFTLTSAGAVKSTPDQTEADIEAELAVRLHDALTPIAADPKYGLATARLDTESCGYIDLLATVDPKGIPQL